VLMDNTGRFKARLEGPVSGNILLRQAHHRQAGDAVFTLEIARAVVAGKIKNSRSVLQRCAGWKAKPRAATLPPSISS
jgi:CRISPR-associated protein Cas1